MNTYYNFDYSSQMTKEDNLISKIVMKTTNQQVNGLM